jgi:HK97 gp10 family phage protein
MLDKKITDMDELDRSISSMVRTLDGRALENAVNAAGAEILKEVQSRAPVKSGKLLASIRELGYKKVHSAKCSISVANSKKYGLRHYAVFLEYGTSKMPSHPFMRPAFEVSKQKAVDAFTESIAAELEKF